MPSALSVDRRKHSRHPLATGIRFYHEPSQRDFPGRCVDISKGGMLMYVPASTPTLPGDSLRVSLPNSNRPEFASVGQTPLDATIVRVDRNALLKIGHMGLGVKFMQA